MIDTFKLEPPSEENGSDMGDVCRWLIQVMDKADKGLPFVVGVYASFFKYGALTPKQSECIMDCFSRVHRQFQENRLDIQGCIGGAPVDGPLNIVSIADAKKPRVSK